jgi:hypothetical protein
MFWTGFLVGFAACLAIGLIVCIVGISGRHSLPAYLLIRMSLT